MSKEMIALVSGANKGLGLETCRQLAGQGIKVMLGARNKALGDRAAASLCEDNLDVTPFELDVTSSEQIEAVRKYIEVNYGKLDILVNNAGMAHPEEPFFTNSVETVTPEILKQTFEVNFFGLVELTLALLPLIKKSQSGRIVNVSSMLGSLALHSRPEAGLKDIKPFAYDASKAAVNQFTIHLAAALHDTDIKVNSAHPGWVKTDLGGDQAPMEVVEGARTSVYLATLEKDGPTGKFFHFQDELPW